MENVLKKLLESYGTCNNEGKKDFKNNSCFNIF